MKVAPAYSISLKNINNKTVLNIDTGFKVLRTDTLLEKIEYIRDPKKVKSDLTGE